MAFLPRRLALFAAAATAACAGAIVPAASAAASNVPAPTLTGPASNATTPLKDVVLTWTGVSGASAYQVQISPNDEWTNNTVTLPGNGVTVATTYDVPLSLPHGTYWWRARAEVGTSWSAYSAADSFLREWEAPLTILQHPTDGSDPTLVWAPVADASEYGVRFSTDPGFASADTVSCITNQTSFTPYSINQANKEDASGDCFSVSDLTDGSTYYWQVEPLDDSTAAPLTASQLNDASWDCAQTQPECDNRGVTGGPFLFTAPHAGTVTPGTITGLTTSWHSTSTTGTDCDTTTVCPMTPTFSWNSVTGANYYEVRVFRDVNGTNTYKVYDSSWPEVTPRDSFLDAQDGAAYSWTVLAGTCQNSDVDPTCAKSTATAASCPSTNTTDTPPTIDSGATGVSASPAGREGAQSMTGGTTATVTLQGSGFQSGLCVEPSAGSLTNTTVVSSSQVTFTYHAPTAASQVTFTVTNPDGAVSGASPVLTVDAGSKVTWYRTSAESAFAKSSGTVTLGSPSDGASLHGRSVTYSWGDFQADGGQGGYDARNYDLQVSSDPDFGSTVIDDPNIDLTQYTDPSTSLADGTYYWRVAPIDESGNVLSWSTPRTFTIDATGPTVSITTKSGVSLKGPLTIHFTEAVSGVNSQTVQIVPASGGSAVAGTLKLGSAPTIYTFRPSSPLVTGETYQLRVASTLVDGNDNPAVVTGSGVRTATTATSTSSGWHYSKGWKHHSASGARSKGYKSAASGHSATLKVVGSKAVLYGCKSPTMGSISVSVGGHTTTVSEKQSFTRCGVALWTKALPAGEQTVTVKVTHTKGNIDELKVS